MAFKNLNGLLLKITNAQKLRKRSLICLKTKPSFKLAYLLREQGFIIGYSCFKLDTRHFLKIFLKYNNFLPVISKIKTISKPSKRIFFSSVSISKFNIDTGLIILHTTRGLLTHKQCKVFNLGGEAIFFIN